jgi:hypothetical protein
VVGGMIDPATMNAGIYTYTVNGTAPCPNASATVTVAINAPPVPGTNGSITLCSSSAPASLLAQLGGSPQAGGTWSGPSPVVGGMIDPATMNAGVYTYTVNGTAPCPNASATVTVAINAMPNAGINGGLTLCSSSGSTPLINGLNGTPNTGGTWTGPGGTSSNGSFTPGIDPPGIYTYSVSGVAPCPSVSAAVNVSVVTNPNAGLPGSLTLCASSAPSLLINALGGTPDAGGAWSGPSPVVGGQFNPATMSAGVYTYTIAAAQRRHRWLAHALHQQPGRAALRRARRRRAGRRQLERPIARGRRAVQPGHHERRHLHLHGERNGALPG